jgi:hypothetical protein
MVRKNAAPVMSYSVLMSVLRSLEIYNTPNAVSTEANFCNKLQVITS